MPQVTIAFPKVAGTANAYTVSSGQPIRVATAQATFDGTGAAGSFLACLSIYSQDGRLLSRSFPDAPVAAGDTAKVSFFPGLSTGGGGIQYDKLNSGDWFQLFTTSRNANTLMGIYLYSQGATNSTLIQSDKAVLLNAVTTVSSVVGLNKVDVLTTGVNIAGGTVALTGTTQVNLSSSGTGAGGAVNISASAADINISSSSGSSGDIHVKLRRTGGQVFFEDHLGSPIFEIREDGSIHGRAAIGAITWDL